MPFQLDPADYDTGRGFVTPENVDAVAALVKAGAQIACNPRARQRE